MFVVFGSLLTLDGLFGDGWAAVAIVAITLLIARPVAIAVALLGTKLPFYLQAFMAWFGPKGVATMTFSLLVLAEGFPGDERIFNLAALCVFASILAHGLTDTPGLATGWLGVQSGLLLSARERPGGLAAALLAEHEPHLRRRPQPVRMVGPERRARLVEFEGAEAVAGEEALLARHLRRPLGARRRGNCGHPRRPLRSRLRHRTWAIKAKGARRFKAFPNAAPAKRRDSVSSPQIGGFLGVFSPFARCVPLSAFSVACQSEGMQTLVTGVSGYVGAALVPRLVRDGHAVRGFARSRERVAAAGAELDDLVLGDATTGAGLDEALDGIDVAYYLIHSMEGATDFAGIELRQAETFAAAAAAAGVRRIVYLGGLVPHDGALSATWRPAWRSRRRCSTRCRSRSRCAPRS